MIMDACSIVVPKKIYCGYGGGEKKRNWDDDEEWEGTTQSLVCFC